MANAICEFRVIRGSCLPFFVEIDQVWDSDDVGAIGDAVFALLPLQHWRGEIVPAKLRTKAVPNHDVALVQPPALFETPLENLLIGSALQHALAKIDIVEPQKIAARAVGRLGGAKVFAIILV